MTAADLLIAVGVAAAVAGCGATRVAGTTADAPVDRPNTGLARFMRESVNVPFSVAVLEHDGHRRARWFLGSAWVLGDAARDLAAWPNPPTRSAAARAVFYTYAAALDRQVERFEDAARSGDLAATTRGLLAIRDTCNTCHRFFRPATAASADVAHELGMVVP
jgi:hypothetical protein